MTAHEYLSTGCFHGDHAYCQGATGVAGAKRPAECKFCGAPCICDCHKRKPLGIIADLIAESPADDSDALIDLELVRRERAAYVQRARDGRTWM